MRIQDISIRYSYMLILLVIIVPVIFFLTISSYNAMKRGILANTHIANEQSKSNIINAIIMHEKAYELASSYYGNIMFTALEDFHQEYQMAAGNIAQVDLNRLKSSYANLMDFYIIDNQGIIVASTFDLVIGLDFKNTPGFYEQLTEIRLGKHTEISKVTADLRTHELRKWGYKPTGDHKYVLEVGIASAELKKYVKNLDYIGVEEQLKRSNPYIKAIDVYDQHHFKFGYEEKETNPEIIEKIDEVINKEENQLFTDFAGYPSQEYIFISTFPNLLNDSRKVIHITYDFTNVEQELISLKTKTFSVVIIYTILGLFFLVALTSYFITNPLIKLTTSVKHISGDNLKINVKQKGNNEIGQLTKSFNKMAEKLQQMLISKFYLDSIIDSIADIVVILDRDFNILRINKYALRLLGYSIADLRGKPIAYIFDESFSIERVKHALKQSENINNIESGLIKVSGEKIVVLSSLSLIKNMTDDIVGYICNAKDITKTKETMVSLEQINSLLKQEEIILKEQSEKDGLTGIYNRRFIMNMLDYLVNNNVEHQAMFSVIMCDIDYFKRVNDNYGHVTGDDILKEMTELLVNASRKQDVVGRYGGEEFLIILPDIAAKDAVRIAERIRAQIERHVFSQGIRITLSGGIAEWKGESVLGLIKLADEKLYKAKESGRNRMCC